VQDLAEWHEWWKHFGASELRHLLLLWWDPVGVYGASGAVDEYDRYSGRIARLLREGADARVIAGYLGHVRHESMGLRRRPEGDAADAAAAERILEWFARAMSLVGGPPPAA
jgi:hypothetical protein